MNLHEILGAMETLDICVREIILLADNRRIVIEKIRKILLEAGSECGDVGNRIHKKLWDVISEYDRDEDENQYYISTDDARLKEFTL